MLQLPVLHTILLYCAMLLAVNNAVSGHEDSVLKTIPVDDLKESVEVSNRSQTDEERLVNTLFQVYDPVSRPVYNASHSVAVTLGMALIQIQKMDEVNQLLTTYVWYEQYWVDERLHWDPAAYNGLKVFRVPGFRLWIPDIVLYNSAYDDRDDDHRTRTMVAYDGNIFYAPLGKLSSTCRIDITCYPFDRQVCKLKFGSWAYDLAQLNLINKSDHMDLANYVESGEWDLKKIDVIRNVVVYPCCPDEQYPDVTFYLHMNRRSLFYWTNIIFPCVWLTVINIATFALPPETGERVTIGITVFLSFSVFMLLVAENIPPTSETRPLLGDYLAVAMSLNAASLITAIILHNIHHSSPFVRRAPPRWVKTIILDRLGPAVGMSISQVERRIAASSEEGDKAQKLHTRDYYALEATASPSGSPSNHKDAKTAAKSNGVGKLESVKLPAKSPSEDKIKAHSRSVSVTSYPSTSEDAAQVRQKKKAAQGAVFRQWKMLTHVLDRLLVIIFVSASILINVVYLFMLPHRTQCNMDSNEF